MGHTAVGMKDKVKQAIDYMFNHFVVSFVKA